MPEFDLTQFLTVDVPARMRTQITEADLPTIGTADTIQEAVLFDGYIPGFYGIYARGLGKTLQGGRRQLTVGSRTQIKRMKFTFALVTENYAGKEAGRLGAWTLLPRCEGALVGWKTSTMLSKLEFADERFVLRTPDTTRVVHEFDLEADVEVFTTPAAP